MEAILFYLLAAVLITFAVLTVTASNPVRSAIYLISALLSVAGLFFLLQAEFVGAVQILVYVGGIMVLFLFVILLVDVGEFGTQRKTSRQWRAGIIVGVALAIQFGVLLVRGAGFFAVPAREAGLETARSLNTESVGQLLYNEYLLPFEIASVLLLVAMVGAVVLAKKEL